MSARPHGIGPRTTAAILIALVVGSATAAAQTTPVLDVKTDNGDELATVRADSMRLAVPLHLLVGGIRFPDGSVQTTATTAATGTAAAADSTSESTGGTVVARDGSGGFSAAGVTISGERFDPVIEAVNTTDAAGAARFGIENVSSSSTALEVETNGSGSFPSHALQATATGNGSAGMFRIENSGSNARAVVAGTDGAGAAVYGFNTGTGTAGEFEITNASNDTSALLVQSNGGSAAVRVYTTGNGRTASFVQDNTDTFNSAVEVVTMGNGAAGRFHQRGDGGDIITALTEFSEMFRVESDGDVYAAGTVTSNGADLAESFEVEEERSSYEPGDVLAISTHTDRTLEMAAEPYSTRVAGVYATKPGVLLGEHGAAGPPDDEVPLGMVGVVPTKVSAENGPIRRGDLLVTSSIPGHAMRAEPVDVNGVEVYPTGAILGKALEPLDAGTGVIQVLVNVR